MFVSFICNIFSCLTGIVPTSDTSTWSPSAPTALYSFIILAVFSYFLLYVLKDSTQVFYETADMCTSPSLILHISSASISRLLYLYFTSTLLVLLFFTVTVWWLLLENGQKTVLLIYVTALDVHKHFTYTSLIIVYNYIHVASILRYLYLYVNFYFSCTLIFYFYSLIVAG